MTGSSSIVVISVATIVWGWPAPAVAGGCTFNATTHVATVTTTSFGIDVKRDGSNITVDGQPCGTVTTLDLMTFSFSDAEQGITFDLTGGPLAPGYTSEGDGSSEIEFEIDTNQTKNPFSVIQVIGIEGPDNIALGQRLVDLTTAQVVNLNVASDKETGSPDDDVTIRGAMERFELHGHSGGDTLSGAGTASDVFSAATSVPILVVDGAGADKVAGGSAGDSFLADDDPTKADRYFGGGGQDSLYFERPYNLTILLNGDADDGENCPGDSCEGDNVGRDIETVGTGAGDDRLVGTGGAQRFLAGDGENILQGRGGDDYLEAGDGKDVFHGGDGFDTVGRWWHLDDPGIRMSIDGRANDGFISEGDNILADVEGLKGTPVGDQLVGSDGANALDGQGGPDIVRGRDGRDEIVGDPWNADDDDIFYGGQGIDTFIVRFLVEPASGMTISLDDDANDQIQAVPERGTDNVHSDIEHIVGTPLADLLKGSATANKLVGGKGGDTLRGLRGNDRLFGNAGDDVLDGGPGDDQCDQGGGSGSKEGCEN